MDLNVAFLYSMPHDYRVQLQKYDLERVSFFSKNQSLKRQLKEEKNRFDIRLREKKRELQKVQTRALERRDTRLKKLQGMVCEKRSLILELADDAKDQTRNTNKVLRSSMSVQDKLKKRTKQRDEKAKWWKMKYNDLMKQLDDKSCETDELREQLTEWKMIAADMKDQYDNIESMKLLTIPKVWVKNVDKKGKVSCQR